MEVTGNKKKGLLKKQEINMFYIYFTLRKQLQR